MAITLDGTSGLIVSGNTNTLAGVTVGLGAGAVATNTVLGASALAANTSGLQHTVVGASAGASITTNGYLSAVGYQAAYYMTDSNDAFGRQALYGQSGATGYYNVGVGFRSGYSMTSGTLNTAIGNQALYSNTTASGNTAVGYQAGYSNLTGAGNTYLGRFAGYTNTASGNNLCVGDYAGYFSTGADNTFVGARGGSANGEGAGYQMTTGAKNTILGKFGGNQNSLDIRTSSNNIVLSDGDGYPRGICNSSGYWQFGVTSTSSGTAQLSVFSNDLGASNGIQVKNATNNTGGAFVFFTNHTPTTIGSITQNATTTVAYNTSSDYRMKEDVQPMVGALNKIALLKPCTYKWKNEFGGEDGQGFIAHELAEVIPDCVHGIKDAVDENNNPKYQGVDTSFLLATLTAAIQELKAEIDAYKASHP